MPSASCDSELQELRAVMNATRGAVIMQPDVSETPIYSASARRLLGLDLPADRRPHGWLNENGAAFTGELPHEAARRTREPVIGVTMGLVQDNGHVTWLTFDSTFWAAKPGVHGSG